MLRVQTPQCALTPPPAQPIRRSKRLQVTNKRLAAEFRDAERVRGAGGDAGKNDSGDLLLI